MSLTETLGFDKAEVYDENFQESVFKDVAEFGFEVVANFGTFTIEPDGRWQYEVDKRNPDLQFLVTPEDSTQETFTIFTADGTEVEFTVNITGAPLNFAVQIPSDIDEPNVFAIDFLHGGITPTDVSNGKIAFRAKLTEDMLTYGNLGFTCAKWNGNLNGGGDNRRVAQFYMQPDDTFEMWSAEIVPGGSYDNGAADYAKNENNQFITKRVMFDQMHIKGEWMDFVMSWRFNEATSLTYLTLSINDEAASSTHGAIPADPTQEIVAQTVAGSRLYKCLDEARFYVRSNDDGGTGALLIDDIKLFTDINADSIVFSVFFDDAVAQGTITVGDDNPAEAFFAPDQTPSATYGTVTFNSDTGLWVYTLDNSNSDVAALNYVDDLENPNDPPTLDDTFIVTSLDGTEQTVTMTIKGNQLVAADIDGIPGGMDAEPPEGEDPVVNPDVFVNINAGEINGALTKTDPNFGQEKFEVVTEFTTTYGTFSIDEAGIWNYSLNGDLDVIKDHKGDGVMLPDPLIDEILVSAVDGTTAILPVTISPLVGGNLAGQFGGSDGKDAKWSIDIRDKTDIQGKASFYAVFPDGSTRDAKLVFSGRTWKGKELHRVYIALTVRQSGELRLNNETSNY